MIKNIHVIVIEDHHLLLRAMVEELDKQPDIDVVGSANHGDKLFQLVRSTVPDVVVLDLGMSEGGFEPLASVRQLMQEHPKTRVLVLTGRDDELMMRELIDAGVQGYLLKGDEASLNLAAAVRNIARGEPVFSTSIVGKLISANRRQDLLTDQEVSVLRLLGEGLDNDHIGKALGVSERRARNVVSQIYRKMGLRDEPGINPRVAAVVRAREMGMLPQE
jgi:NarL family two-component system response regulator LiaR